MTRKAAARAAPAAEWYAVTADGASALRIAPGLTLGEHPDGALALNARAAEARWVTFELRRGEAALSAVKPRRLVAEDRRAMDRVPLSDGLCLALPNHLLRISHSIQAPAATGPTLSVRPAGSAPAAQPGAAATEPAGSVLAPGQGAEPGSAPPRAESAVGLRPAVAVLLGAGTVTIALLAWWLQPASLPAADGPATLEDGPVSTTRAGTAAGGADVALNDSAAAMRLPATPLRLLPLPAGPAVAPATDGSDGSAPAAPGAAPADPRLEAARRHFEAGRITYPPGSNAVALALAVLEDHPRHAGAMDLLGRCTSRLLDEARAHRAAGRDYAARNTLEELLGFNPEHPEARQLWTEWIGSRR